ncbi:hypothetical protein AAHA92_30738 [Salvia divinorum]|uniref:MADS-box domain-containing protein n=1 Tax=Salvia divinorum TaxID=28513 RepID=A0ABD1FSD5_SALDI
MENPKKKTLGRRKIEIKKIEKKSSLQVAFTKRRGGLFRKASELTVVCGVEVAILVKSPADKLHSFGHPPDVEALISRAEEKIVGGMEQYLKFLEDFGGKVEENLR